MNDLQRSIPKIRFSGGGASVSHLGSQVFVRMPRPLKYPIPINQVGALQPGSDVSTDSAPMFTITVGQYGGVTPTISGTPLSADTSLNIITFGDTDTYAYIQCDFTYDESTGIKTIVDAEIIPGSGGLPSSTISGGNGIQYEILINVAIISPVDGGSYSVIGRQGVGGSKDFNICLAGPSISGPFRA